MADSIMYQEDAYVVLETGLPEQFLTYEELLEKLKQTLINYADNIPRELNKFTSLEEKAEYLLKNYCDFDIEPGKYLEWYVVRLEK